MDTHTNTHAPQISVKKTFFIEKDEETSFKAMLSSGEHRHAAQVAYIRTHNQNSLQQITPWREKVQF